MPIRFRCAYCNQLMGIGRRKAGTIIRCPRCAGEVIVPAEQPAPAAAGPAAFNPIFEQEDFAQELADVQAVPEPPKSVASASYSHAPFAESDSQGPAATSGAPQSLRRPGLFLPTPILILAVGVLIGLLAVAFALGFMLGRSSAP